MPRVLRRSKWVLAAIFALPLMLSDHGRAAETMEIVLDQAEVVKLPEHIGTIVVGNPLIADVSVQSGGLLVVTGKGYGRTNVIVLDRSGNVLLERVVQVQGPRNVVVVYRGADRESYSCEPKCERRITLGDAQPFFEGTLTQTGTRNVQAAGGGQPH